MTDAGNNGGSVPTSDRASSGHQTEGNVTTGKPSEEERWARLELQGDALQECMRLLLMVLSKDLTALQSAPDPRADGDGPRLDPNMFTVTGEDGHVCELGYSMGFSVLAVLLRHPGVRVAQSTLMAEAWHGTVVSTNTVRSTISRLRKTLRESGLVELAESIESVGEGAYTAHPYWRDDDGCTVSTDFQPESHGRGETAS